MKWYWKFILTIVCVILSCAGVVYFLLPESRDDAYERAVADEVEEDESYTKDEYAEDEYDGEEYAEERYLEDETEEAMEESVPVDGPTTHQKIRWDVLGGLNLKKGESSKALDEIIGKKIRIPGFVVPLEISDRLTQTFLLVPTAGACYHVPPPPPNQMIYVKLTNGGVPSQEKRAPIWVYGTLRITQQKTEWGKVGFKMIGEEIHPFKGGY